MISSIGQVGIPAGIFKPSPPAQSFIYWLDGRLDMTVKRKQLSKKIRFEVFKRDSFKCQYCGSSAPDVVLNVDHIEPVSKGGDNSISNLITSCFSCNSGKKDIRLDDNSLIAKQKQQLDELNEKRQQLKMMLDWRNELKAIDTECLDILISNYHSHLKGYQLNDHGIDLLKKLLHKHGMKLCMDAIDKAAQRIVFDSNGNATPDSASSFSSDISKYCNFLKLPEAEQQLRYIRGIVRNRMYCHDIACMQILKDAYESGATLEVLTDIAKTARNWTEFRNSLWDLM